MEFCKVALTFESVKSYDVTIQMKPLYLYLHMVLLVFQNFTKWNLGFFVEFYLWTHLAVKGVKTEQCDVSIPTSTAITAPSSSSWSLLAFRSSLSCYKNGRFYMNKRIFVWKKFSHCGITQRLKSNVIIVMVITSGEILDKPRLTWIWYWSRCFFWRTAKLKR